jgi:hypothetical protein
MYEKQYLFVREMGSFKHEVDDKLNLRKEAYNFLAKNFDVLA